jgi:hypothetical protein
MCESVRSIPLPSCPRLSRASTPFFGRPGKQGVDGRDKPDKPGHDARVLLVGAVLAARSINQAVAIPIATMAVGVRTTATSQRGKCLASVLRAAHAMSRSPSSPCFRMATPKRCPLYLRKISILQQRGILTLSWKGVSRDSERDKEARLVRKDPRCWKLVLSAAIAAAIISSVASALLSASTTAVNKVGSVIGPPHVSPGDAQGRRLKRNNRSSDHFLSRASPRARCGKFLSIGNLSQYV